MAAARTRRTNAPDTRAINFQPNNLPEHVVVVVSIDGEEVGPMAIPQNGKLSAKGNVTYKGGINGGWELEGDPTATLNSLTYVVNGVELKPSSDGAHLSSNQNPTIFHGGVIEIKAFDADAPGRHRVSVWTTYSEKYQAYTVEVSTMPVPAPRPRGPQIVGQVGSGFVLRPRSTTAAPATAA